MSFPESATMSVVQSTHASPQEEPRVYPPFISLNFREKIVPEEISQTIFHKKQKETKHNKLLAALMWLPEHIHVTPVPRYPILISWWPEVLCFTIDKKVVIQRLCVSNRSDHMLTLVCNGLWEETARIGAKWKTWPHTRIYVAPGIITHLYLRAIPRSSSSVPYARCGLQISTSHQRDLVTGYFVVPIHVKFRNFIPEASPEDEEIADTSDGKSNV